MSFITPSFVLFSNSLKMEVAEARERSSVTGGRYRQNQLLEELRQLQDSMAREKVQWQAEKEASELEMQAKMKELARTQVFPSLKKKSLFAQHLKLFELVSSWRWNGASRT